MMTLITDFLYNLDSFLQQMVLFYPYASYFLLFAIVFLETAFVPLTPLLPGHGLLIIVGVLAAKGIVGLPLAIPALLLGGILGNMMAYQLGHYFGPNIFERTSWLEQKHYDEVQQFYEQYGNRAFILSRFVPMVRVLMPLVAGMTRMKYFSFMMGNVLSMTCWILSLTLIPFYLGHIPFVQQNFLAILVGVGIVGFVALLVVAYRSYFKETKKDF